MSDRLLVVSATLLEVAPSLLRETGIAHEGAGPPGSLIEGSTGDFLITGVGQLLCGVHLTRALATGTYTQVLQVGIGGSFDPSLHRGTVVVVGGTVVVVEVVVVREIENDFDTLRWTVVAATDNVSRQVPLRPVFSTVFVSEQDPLALQVFLPFELVDTKEVNL